jgi:opacity protein-like surface antigen
MLRESSRVLWAVLLTGASIPATAQVATTPPVEPQSAPAAPAGTEGISISPKNGQNEQQQWNDRYECHRWAVNQSGFDPSRRTTAAPSDTAAGREQYQRALTACLEGRGYEVHQGATQSSAPPPTSQPVPARRIVPVVTEPRYRPLSVSVGGGYTVTSGTTGRFLDNGGNVGVGLTWFPSPAVPIGLRVDGSYNWFDTRHTLYDPGSDTYTLGHEYVYGGDVGLQFDLAHQSPRAKLYVFGGAGWYREQIRLRQLSLQSGIVCDIFFCGHGYFPVVTGYERSTSPWRSSWTAGLGWQIANDDGAAFFIEARYMRIAPRDSQTAFVPIRVGLRF